MPNLSTVLKEEITRLARKQINAEIGPLKKRLVQQRKVIAALKDEQVAMKRDLAALSRRAPAGATVAEPEGEGKRRFRVDGFRTFRARLGLSARDLARLLGVSEQTIYNWEGAATRPQPSMVEAITALRGLGKRELMARLDKLKAAS